MTEPALDVRDLRHVYPGAAVPAVDGMTFSVERGEIFGFLGPNGAGKTTTLRALVGLVDGWSGEVRLLGRDRREWGREIYDRIGVSFELPAAYERLTARENLLHFGNLHGTEPREAGGLLESIGLGDAANRLVSGLSKGMRVRLNLALALVHGPELLFLDEPTGGLDPVTATNVRDVIRAERDAAHTVFLTTHDMHTADVLCDRVAFVVEGRVAVCDSPRALKRASGKRSVRVEYGAADGAVKSRSFALSPPARELIEILESGTVESLHSEEASLEDVFVQVTGAKL